MNLLNLFIAKNVIKVLGIAHGVIACVLLKLSLEIKRHHV
ncbi:MAG: hypothetical protein US25_C0038G0012 [Candidatus Moranbacteria bacterium GW2011_GWE1_36_7]|nr:MAG: hypothetical protein US25_C0038G0012 [Candidatus Moranbacteria bacterium GW2011_GWE1_36_7]